MNDKYDYVYISPKKPKGEVEILGKFLKTDINKKLKIRAELGNSLKKSDIVEILNNNKFQLIYLNELYSLFKDYFFCTKHFKLIKDLSKNKINYENIYNFPEKVGDLYEYNISQLTRFYKDKYNINPIFFEKLRDFVVPGVGRGEYLFGLFLKCKNLIDSDRGDLVYNKTIIELKGYRGKTRGTIPTRYAIEAQKEIKETLLSYNILTEDVENYLNKSGLSHTLFLNKSLVENIIKHKEKYLILNKLINAFRLYNNNDYIINKKDIKLFEYVLKTNNKYKISAFLLSIHMTHYILKEYKNKDLMFLFFKKMYNDFVFCKLSKRIGKNFEILSNLKITLCGWASTPQESSFGIQIKNE